MQVPRPLYFLVTTIATELILAASAILLLIPTGLLNRIPIGMIGFLLAYNAIVATLILTVLANSRLQEERTILRGGGLVMGHLVGLILGGFLGLHYGGALGAIIGAVLMYFIVGQFGAMLSLAIAARLDRLTSVASGPGPMRISQPAQPGGLLLLIYGALVPMVILSVAVLLRGTGNSNPQFANGLPAARAVLIALSLLSLLLPWLFRTRRTPQQQLLAASRQPLIFVIGLALSNAPSIYGLFLFFGFGASIAELSIFAVASSIAAMIWGASSISRQ